MRLIAGTCLAIAALALTALESTAADSGVIFMYHHVDTETPASTSVRPDEFEAQIEWLASEGFTVMPLLEMLEKLQTGDSVPDRAVAITFDDAYSSVLTTAMPILHALDWPFTVFVSTEAVDRGYRGYLGWDELRELQAHGATFGNHSVTHTHLVRQLDGESLSAWEQRVRDEIRQARRRLQSELGDALIPVFAYPYGEYTADVRALLTGLERFGLGQHSGAVGYGSDFLAAPRYPVATGLDLSEFALRARSRSLPVQLASGAGHILAAGQDWPELRLKLDANDDVRTDELACYASGQGRMDLEWVDDARSEVRIRPQRALGTGRSKMNCTAPSRTLNGVWYWYGYLWMRQLPDGSWYEE